MTKSDFDGNMAQPAAIENDERKVWERPALLKLGAEDAAYGYAGSGYDGYYYS